MSSANELARAQRVNLFDALRLSPGVTAAQVGRRGGVTSLFVRGGEPDYTKVLIDGAPVNDAGGSYDFADLTADNAARVELIRGSHSAVYGSDAMTGVLQFFTHRGSTSAPEFEFAGEGGVSRSIVNSRACPARTADSITPPASPICAPTGATATTITRTGSLYQSGLCFQRGRKCD